MRNFILQNFPFLEDDFDALTDYQLFCKMLAYVKKFAKDNKEFSDRLTALENYVYNLDLQDEVDNKIQELYENGSLAEIITTYLEIQGILGYDTVADLKEATNLINGSLVRTFGFYNINDGGGTFYKVRTLINTDVVDEITLISLDNDTLVAELLKKNIMSVKEFGAKGDGTRDDTTNIQGALDNCKNLIIDNGTYMIDTSIGIKPNSDSNIKLINATLKAITTNLGNYEIMYINNKSNIIIEGGTIQGERSTHTGEGGEWGYCIRIDNGTNITIKNIILKDAWGDGLYINGGTNINTQNIVCDNNRRQGISIIKVNGYHSLNDKLINTNGTAPESGIDIEPNYNTDYLQNIILENLYTENNNGAGVSLYLFSQDNTSTPISIKVINHHDSGSNKGELITLNKLVRHNILFENSLLQNNNYGIDLSNCYDNGIDKVQIIRPKVVNCNYNLSTYKYMCGITCYTNDTTSDSLGGFTIIEPFVTSMLETERAGILIYDDHNSVKCTNVDIINPINKQSNLQLRMYASNVVVKDTYNKYLSNSNGNFTLTYYSLFTSVTNINFTATRTITLNADVPTGFEVTFTNEKATNPIIIKMSDTEYVRYFNNNTGNTISLNGINASITLKRVYENEWIVTNIIGSVSV